MVVTTSFHDLLFLIIGIDLLVTAAASLRMVTPGAEFRGVTLYNVQYTAKSFYLNDSGTIKDVDRNFSEGGHSE